MSRLFTLLLMAVVVYAFACDKKPAGIDESNLELVVASYYHPGRRERDPDKSYTLLASKTREQIGPGQWKDALASQTGIVDSAIILRKESVKGVSYGIVSFSETRNGSRSISTATWVLEQNKWRRLKLPRQTWDIDLAIQANKYSAAKTGAESLLVIDPFSMEAYEALLYCSERAGLHSKLPGAGTPAAIVQTMLKINSEDTRALFTAIYRAKDTKSGEKYLQRLKGTTRYRAAVDLLAAKSRAAQPVGPTGTVDDTSVLIQKLLILADMKERREFKRLASNDATFEKLKTYLEGVEPEDAVKYAAKLGMAYHKAGDKKRAEGWLDFGFTFGLRSEELHRLGDMVDKDTP